MIGGSCKQARINLSFVGFCEPRVVWVEFVPFCEPYKAAVRSMSDIKAGGTA